MAVGFWASLALDSGPMMAILDGNHPNASSQPQQLILLPMIYIFFHFLFVEMYSAEIVNVVGIETR